MLHEHWTHLFKGLHAAVEDDVEVAAWVGTRGGVLTVLRDVEVSVRLDAFLSGLDEFGLVELKQGTTLLPVEGPWVELLVWCQFRHDVVQELASGVNSAVANERVFRIISLDLPARCNIFALSCCRQIDRHRMSRGLAHMVGQIRSEMFIERTGLIGNLWRQHVVLGSEEYENRITLNITNSIYKPRFHELLSLRHKLLNLYLDSISRVPSPHKIRKRPT